ncbi:MAG TPA: 50S ribosomal protein L15 [Verrucomicrobiae bacterium]|jgi:large subunit ribosomal protein L15|nr:50S ribosomal protein L15 [Verrucomicrobiae bacterium]
MKAKFPYSKKVKRRGCGIGSGHGKTSCRGHKGQRARAGATHRPNFEGGQNPLYRRLPKRGFNRSDLKAKYRVVNVGLIAELGEAEVTPEVLISRGVISSVKDGLKVLGGGDVKKAVIVKAHFFSEGAKEKLSKAGGQAIVINK